MGNAKLKIGELSLHGRANTYYQPQQFQDNKAKQTGIFL